MDRRAFLNAACQAGVAVLVPSLTRGSSPVQKGIQLPEMQLSWQRWMTTRPFAPDYDSEGRIWFGSSKFFCYDPVTQQTELFDNTPLSGKSYSTCLCQGEKVYVLTQKSPELYVFHRKKKLYSRHLLPDRESNIWYGVRVPDDPRLYLYVRNRSKLTVWDSEREQGHVINYPETMDLWSGFHVPNDEALYSFTLEAKPCRLVRFDLKKQKFDQIIPAPEPALEITGVNPIGTQIYCADRFTGRIFPFDIVHRTWSTPVSLPGFRTVFSFIGTGTSFGGKAYYCLSTYKGSMKWDFNKNTYLSTGDENIGIDGKPHHFLNKYMVYDPGSGESAFLEASATRGKRYPLLCYCIVCNGRLIITGYDLGDPDHNLTPMGEREGELCVFQSVNQQ